MYVDRSLTSSRGSIVARDRKIETKSQEGRLQLADTPNRWKVSGLSAFFFYPVRALERTVVRVFLREQRISTSYSYLCTAPLLLKRWDVWKGFGLLSRYANISSKSSEESLSIYTILIGWARPRSYRVFGNRYVCQRALLLKIKVSKFSSSISFTGLKILINVNYIDYLCRLKVRGKIALFLNDLLNILEICFDWIYIKSSHFLYVHIFRKLRKLDILSERYLMSS